MQGQFLCQVIGLSRINFGEGMPRFAQIHVLQSVRPDETDKRGQEEIRLVMPYEMFDSVSAFPIPGLWRITVELSKCIDWAPEHGGMVRPYALAAEPVSPERPITGPGGDGSIPSRRPVPLRPRRRPHPLCPNPHSPIRSARRDQQAGPGRNPAGDAL